MGDALDQARVEPGGQQGPRPARMPFSAGTPLDGLIRTGAPAATRVTRSTVDPGRLNRIGSADRYVVIAEDRLRKEVGQPQRLVVFAIEGGICGGSG